METTIAEIADDIYRMSTFVDSIGPTGFTFNQYLVRADEPMLFHCGSRALFPLVSEAVASVMPLEELRWISFGHFEADECGALNEWLGAAPYATVAFNELGCNISLNDFAARAPHAMADGEVLDLGSHRLRLIATPHVPHGWDAQVLHDETTGTLFCGDLFTQAGHPPVAVDHADMITPALDAEDLFLDTCLTPNTAPTMRRLAALEPSTLALMHGPAYRGDGGGALRDLAGAYAERHAQAAEAVGF